MYSRGAPRGLCTPRGGMGLGCVLLLRGRKVRGGMVRDRKVRGGMVRDRKVRGGMVRDRKVRGGMVLGMKVRDELVHVELVCGVQGSGEVMHGGKERCTEECGANL